jgi:hypothetical protein
VKPPAAPRWAKERAFPRVQYPSHRRPYLVTRDEICEVVDCSERGLRFGGAIEVPVPGAVVSARVCFRSGTEVAVRGRVVRVQGGEVAMELEAKHGIPAEVIAAEEAALRDEP